VINHTLNGFDGADGSDGSVELMALMEPGRSGGMEEMKLIESMGQMERMVGTRAAPHDPPRRCSAAFFLAVTALY
jgi:hypothetical protein